MKFVNNCDNFYFSEENDNQQGSVEEQLSILKAIFLGKRTKMLNNLFERQVNTTVGHLNSQFTSKKHYREYRLVMAEKHHALIILMTIVSCSHRFCCILITWDT